MPAAKKVREPGHGGGKLVATTQTISDQLQAIQDAQKRIAELERKWRESIGQLALDAGLGHKDDALIPEVLRVGKIAVDEGLHSIMASDLHHALQMLVYALRHDTVYDILKETIAEEQKLQGEDA